jgi:hypothetical protein
MLEKVPSSTGQVNVLSANDRWNNRDSAPLAAGVQAIAASATRSAALYSNGSMVRERYFITGDETPCTLSAHRCVIEASIDASRKQAYAESELHT